jgi:molybdopterin-guanine dinucleotide biosynthesis protein A
MRRMKADTGRVGIVLAGGRSTRFEDGDKALAALDGRPLLVHAVDAVSPVVDDVIVSCREDQRRSFASALAGRDVTLVADRIDDLGPVAGLRTALCETERLTAVVTPCDTPFVPSAFLGHLLDRVEQSTTAGVVIRVDEMTQPLPAAVNVRAAAAAATETLDRSGTLRDVTGALAPVVIPERHVEATVGTTRLLNINTREALARAESLLARGVAPTTTDGPSADGERVRSDGR